MEAWHTLQEGGVCFQDDRQQLVNVGLVLDLCSVQFTHSVTHLGEGEGGRGERGREGEREGGGERGREGQRERQREGGKKERREREGEVRGGRGREGERIRSERRRERKREKGGNAGCIVPVL